MYTLEINGEPIAVMNANEDTAHEWFHNGIFKSDLLSFLKADGTALWDGTEKFFIRRAFAEEFATFERGFAKAVMEGSADREDEDGYLVFLVTIRPSEEDDA